MDEITAAFQKLDFGKIINKLAGNIKDWALSAPTASAVEIAYFLGLATGLVVEMVIEIAVGIMFTGGVLTIESILAKLGQAFKELGGLLIDGKASIKWVKNQLPVL